VGTLTAWPVAAPQVVDRRSAGRAMVLAPLVGAGLGTLAALVVWVGDAVRLSSLLTATLVVAVLALTTRGLHLDGLADTADGLAASYDRARALAVMRTGDVGPAGAATLVLVLLVQVAALAQVGGVWGPAPVGVAVAVSRLALPSACLRGVPPARPDGLGATVAGTVHRLSATALVVLVTLAAGAVLLVGGSPTWHAPAAVLAAVTATVVLVRRAVVRFGGVTGDVLGAGVEVALAAALVVLAIP
jgi:adenosylcobinamide-GDP ribazoletransferase